VERILIRAQLNKKGVTLVEVMIALVVLLLVFLALMQTALVSISYNMNNVLRDEAVSIAEMRLNDAKSQGVTNVQSDATNAFIMKDDLGNNIDPAAKCPSTWPFGQTGVYVERTLKNVQSFGFCTNVDVQTIGDGKQVTVLVGWKWKGQDFTHTSTVIVGQL
jgi:prepilin-type N-terminal cleavage/methylation domain-containing protein